MYRIVRSEISFVTGNLELFHRTRHGFHQLRRHLSHKPYIFKDQAHATKTAIDFFIDKKIICILAELRYKCIVLQSSLDVCFSVNIQIRRILHILSTSEFITRVLNSNVLYTCKQQSNRKLTYYGTPMVGRQGRYRTKAVRTNAYA